MFNDRIVNPPLLSDFSLGNIRINEHLNGNKNENSQDWDAISPKVRGYPLIGFETRGSALAGEHIVTHDDCVTGWANTNC